jgi:hypothetical protein
MWTMGGVAGIATAVLGLIAIPRAPGLVAITAAYVVPLAAFPHKESRFIVPALPLFAALAGIGLERTMALAIRCARFTRPIALGASAILVLLAAVSSLTAPRLTWGDVGQHSGFYGGGSAWGFMGEVNRLLKVANDQSDICGLRVEGPIVVWTGGYTYLHKDVPFFDAAGPSRESGYANYVLAPTDPSFPEVARDGGWALMKLPVEQCKPYDGSRRLD